MVLTVAAAPRPTDCSGNVCSGRLVGRVDGWPRPARLPRPLKPSAAHRVPIGAAAMLAAPCPVYLPVVTQLAHRRSLAQLALSMAKYYRYCLLKCKNFALTLEAARSSTLTLPLSTRCACMRERPRFLAHGVTRSIGRIPAHALVVFAVPSCCRRRDFRRAFPAGSAQTCHVLLCNLQNSRVFPHSGPTPPWPRTAGSVVGLMCQ